MKKAIIEGGCIVNVIEVADSVDLQPDWVRDLPDAGHAGPGWIWDGDVFTPPPEAPPAATPPAPDARAVIVWLHGEGIITDDERAAWLRRAGAKA